MGGSSSKTEVKTLQEQLNNVIISSVQSCEISSTQNQNVNIINSGFSFWRKYDVQQTTEIRSDCFSDVSRQTLVQNSIISTIANSSTADGVSLLSAFGASTSESTSNLTNIVRNNINFSNIQKTYTAISQQQSLSVINSGISIYENITLTQGSQIFAAATLQELDKSGVFNKISTHLDASSKATTSSPLDFIAQIFSSYFYFVMVFIFVILAAIVGIGFLLFKS